MKSRGLEGQESINSKSEMVTAAPCLALLQNNILVDCELPFHDPLIVVLNEYTFVTLVYENLLPSRISHISLTINQTARFLKNFSSQSAFF